MDRSFAPFAAGRHTHAMMIRIGAACAITLLALAPGFAETKTTPKAGDTPAAVPSPTPPANAPAPVSSPPELSHQDMVEEQERRDREAQAERDRDDQD